MKHIQENMYTEGKRQRMSAQQEKNRELEKAAVQDQKNKGRGVCVAHVFVSWTQRYEKGTGQCCRDARSGYSDCFAHEMKMNKELTRKMICRETICWSDSAGPRAGRVMR